MTNAPGRIGGKSFNRCWVNDHIHAYLLITLPAKILNTANLVKMVLWKRSFPGTLLIVIAVAKIIANC